ncbi:hypothetical protein [Candidatus Uabimicrobium sp. HlEnr_7]|uniref:hypothetical protein n=1 Tax=Candidatus Uabimicrobium helgolandensis TaxID=3095367 RepID=UPI0035581D75
MKKEAKKTKRNKVVKRNKANNLLKRNWLACFAGLAIFASLFMPWIGETKGLEQIWQTKNERKVIEHVYHPQQDSLIFGGHLTIIFTFMLIVFVEYWRAKAGKFSATIYMILAAIILVTLGFSYIEQIKIFGSGMWLAISGSLLLGLAGSTMFYVKR